MRIHLKTRTLRGIEFLVIGVLFGLLEDIIVVQAVSDVVISPRVILTILAGAIPFAVVSELVVDHPKFWTAIRLRRPDDDTDSENTASG